MSKKVSVKKIKKKPKAEVREEKKQKVLKIIIGIFMAFIMTSGILGYVNNRLNPNVVKDHGLRFYRSQDNLYWITRINNKQQKFFFLPKQLEQINVSPLVKPRVLGTKLVLFTFNPKQDQQVLTYMDLLRLDVGQVLYEKGIITRSGITVKDDRYKDFPIITCANSSQPIPVIYLNLGNKTEIYLNDTCIVAEASSPYEILALRDKLLYLVYDVI